MSRSEIRPSEINQLLEKARDRSYGKYLAAIDLTFVRGIRDQRISFDFPVTAIIGTNGGGKTTILGAAGLIYKSIPPSRFFSKGGLYDNTMQDWKIGYEVIDRKDSKNSYVNRTASFRQKKWNRDSLEREVLVFGVNRTVPASEKKEFRRFSSNNFSVPKANEVFFSTSVIEAAGRVLGKDISKFKKLKVDISGKVTLLTAEAENNISYSEFHFGAGESSVIRMISEIESAETNAMILIEEIENGLHPVATVRLVDYLIRAAKNKSLQVIFTTHSNDALIPLPDKAVWVASQDRIFQGKLDIASLRAISGKIEKKLAIFVEDEFAKLWVEAILRVNEKSALDQIEIHALSGDGNAFKMSVSHNKNPAVGTKAICILDGDSSQDDTAHDFVYRLPGQMPEAYVFDCMMERWNEVGGVLTVALLQPFNDTDKVKLILEEMRMTNMDEHVLFNQVGERLGFIPEATVQMAFANVWGQIYGKEVEGITDAVKAAVSS